MPTFGQFSPTSQVFADLLSRMVVTNNQVVPGIPCDIVFTVPDAVTSDIDIVVTEKIEVIDVVVRKDSGAGAGNTMQLKTGAGVAISDAIACAVDKTITRAGTIDTASNVIAAGGTLRLTATKSAGTRNALVTVKALIRP